MFTPVAPHVDNTDNVVGRDTVQSPVFVLQQTLVYDLGQYSSLPFPSARGVHSFTIFLGSIGRLLFPSQVLALANCNWKEFPAHQLVLCFILHCLACFNFNYLHCDYLIPHAKDASRFIFKCTTNLGD